MPQDPAGLCAHCTWCRVVDSGRSTFYLCRRSLTDPAYRKYPPLPVVRCPGHVEGRPEPRVGDKLDG